MVRKRGGRVSVKNVSKPAYYIFKYALILSCLLLAASLLTGVFAGEIGVHNLRLFFLYRELYRAPQGILLTAALGALIVDDAIKK